MNERTGEARRGERPAGGELLAGGSSGLGTCSLLALGTRIFKRQDATGRADLIVGGPRGVEKAQRGLAATGGGLWAVGRGRAVVDGTGRLVARVPEGAGQGVELAAVAKALAPVTAGRVVAILGDRVVVRPDAVYSTAIESEVVDAVTRATVAKLHSIVPLYAVEKADPTTPAGFLESVRTVRRKLANAYGPASKQQLTDILRLLDAPWNDLTERVRQSLLEQIAAVFPAETLELVEPQALEVMGSGARALYRSIRRKLAETLPVKAALALPDEKAIEWLGKTTVAYARNQYGRIAPAMSARARTIIGRGMEAGYSNQDIAGQLSATIRGSYEANMANYWTVVASNAVGRSRASSQLHCYQEAEIEKVMAYAVMDERTTEFCRLIHEQVIDVRTVSEQMTGLEGETDMEQIKERSPWVVQRGNEWGVWRGGEWDRLMTVDRPGAGTWDKGQYSAVRDAKYMADRGIGFPPYHALCRTTTITLAETMTTPVEVNIGA